MFEIDCLTHRKAHAATFVNDQLTTQVGLLLIAFHKEFLSTAIEFPVDMADRFTRIIEAMFGKLYGKSMERAFVKTRDESFHNLSCQKLQAAELRQPISINFETHIIKKNKQRRHPKP